MSEAASEISLTLSEKGVTLKNERNAHFPQMLRNRDASEIINLMGSVYALCPAAHISAFSGAFESAQSAIATESIALLARLEAIIETVRFFSMDLRKILGLGVAEKTLIAELAKVRARLSASLLGQTDTALMNDTTALACHWLTGEKDFFATLFDRTREVEQFTFSSEALLEASELSDPHTLSALALTLKDCPPFALSPRLGRARVLGAIARGPRRAKKTLITIEEVFKARISEIEAFVGGKASTIGSLHTVPIDTHEAASFVETARGLLIYFVHRNRNSPTWIEWIAPTEWVFQNNSVLTDLAHEAFLSGATNAQIALIAAAFDACADVTIAREVPNA